MGGFWLVKWSDPNRPPLVSDLLKQRRQKLARKNQHRKRGDGSGRVGGKWFQFHPTGAHWPEGAFDFGPFCPPGRGAYKPKPTREPLMQYRKCGCNRASTNPIPRPAKNSPVSSSWQVRIWQITRIRRGRIARRRVLSFRVCKKRFGRRGRRKLLPNVQRNDAVA